MGRDRRGVRREEGIGMEGLVGMLEELRMYGAVGTGK